MTLRETAMKALEIMQAHEEGADMDAGFDGGEFSGPAHARMAQKEIAELATACGFTYEEVDDEMMMVINEDHDSEW